MEHLSVDDCVQHTLYSAKDDGPVVKLSQEAIVASHGDRTSSSYLPRLAASTFMMYCRPLMRDGTEETDVEFATRLTKEAGVTVIPVSALLISCHNDMQTYNASSAFHERM